MGLAWLSGGKAVMQGGKPILCNDCPCKICGNECWFDGTLETNGDGTPVSPYNSISAIMTYIHNNMSVACRCMIVHCVTNGGIHSSEIVSIANGFSYVGNNYNAYMVFVHEGDTMFDFYVDHLNVDTTSSSGARRWTYGVEKFDIYMSPTADRYCDTRIFRAIDSTYNIPAFSSDGQLPAISFGAYLYSVPSGAECVMSASEARNLTIREDLSEARIVLYYWFVNVISCDVPDTIYELNAGAGTIYSQYGIVSGLTIGELKYSGSVNVRLYGTIISDVTIASSSFFSEIYLYCNQLNDCTFNVITYAGGFTINQLATGDESASNHSSLYIVNCNISWYLYIGTGKYWDIHLVGDYILDLRNRYATYTSVYVYPTMAHGTITNTGTGNEVIYV